MNVLDITGMKQTIYNGKYENKLKRPLKTDNMKDGYITDENKSVKWNKEQVELANQEYKNKLKKYKDEAYRLEKLFKTDTIDYIMNFYEYNNSAAELIFNTAYERSAHYGYTQILDEVQDIIDFLEKIKDTNIFRR